MALAGKDRYRGSSPKPKRDRTKSDGGRKPRTGAKSRDRAVYGNISFSEKDLLRIARCAYFLRFFLNQPWDDSGFVPRNILRWLVNLEPVRNPDCWAFSDPRRKLDFFPKNDNTAVLEALFLAVDRIIAAWNWERVCVERTFAPAAESFATLQELDPSTRKQIDACAAVLEFMADELRSQDEWRRIKVESEVLKENGTPFPDIDEILAAKRSHASPDETDTESVKPAAILDDDGLVDVHRVAQEAIDALGYNYRAIAADDLERLAATFALVSVGETAKELSKRLTPTTLIQLRREPVTVNGATFPSYTEAVVRICAVVLAPTFFDGHKFFDWDTSYIFTPWISRFRRDGFAVLRWARTRDPENERRFADDSYIQELNEGVDLEFERAEHVLLEVAQGALRERPAAAAVQSGADGSKKPSESKIALLPKEIVVLRVLYEANGDPISLPELVRRSQGIIQGKGPTAESVSINPATAICKKFRNMRPPLASSDGRRQAIAPAGHREWERRQQKPTIDQQPKK